MTCNLSRRGQRKKWPRSLKSRQKATQSSLQSIGLCFAVFRLEATSPGTPYLLLYHVTRTTPFFVRWCRLLSICSMHCPLLLSWFFTTSHLIFSCIEWSSWFHCRTSEELFMIQDKGAMPKSMHYLQKFKLHFWTILLASVILYLFTFIDRVALKYLTLTCQTWLIKLAHCCAYSFFLHILTSETFFMFALAWFFFFMLIVFSSYPHFGNLADWQFFMKGLYFEQINPASLTMF